MQWAKHTHLRPALHARHKLPLVVVHGLPAVVPDPLGDHLELQVLLPYALPQVGHAGLGSGFEVSHQTLQG